MPQGFLAVFSEPGSLVTLPEYQDWYNNEHVPLRMNHLSSFLTGARYEASDAQKPGWLAVYDVDDISTFQHESYTRLRANRSPREGNLVKRLEILDRRTCGVLADSGESNLTTSFRSSNPTKVIVTCGSDDEADALQALETYKGIDGWIRSRAFHCFDSLKTGVGINSGPEAQIVPKYLIIHEISEFNLDLIQSITEPGAVETRVWKLYRAYPGVAQGNM